MSARHLILVGGGLAHLTVLKKLHEFTDAGHRVTLLNPSPYHYFSGMASGLLSGIYDESEARFDLREMVRLGGGDFVESRVERIDPERCRLLLSSGEQFSYDVVSFCIGSRILKERVSGDTMRMMSIKPIGNLIQARQRILERLSQGPVHLVVAGGGTAGVEIAGNLWRLLREVGGSGRICLTAGGRLLRGYAPRFRARALASLQRRGIEVCEGVRLVHLDQGRAILSDETERKCDLALLAVGTRPSTLFRESGLPVGIDGGLLVDDRLRCVEHPRIFGGGDCIDLKDGPSPKTAAHALREGAVLADNLLAELDSEELREYEPPEEPLAILNLGDGTGVLHKRNRVVRGRAVWRLKDWLDRRFMRRFQAPREPEEDAP